jgi:hypothetical protein
MYCIRSGREPFWRRGCSASRRAACQRLEAGERWPSWETYDRIERLFGWRSQSKERVYRRGSGQLLTE